jgi:hypothetical protein
MASTGTIIEWHVQTWNSDGALVNSYRVLETRPGAKELKKFLESKFDRVSIVPAPKVRKARTT